MVILLPDTGMRYLSKIYNDEWMKENQYVEENIRLKVSEVVRLKRQGKKARKLVTAKPTDKLIDALKTMRKHDISQVPVFEKSKPVGSVFEDRIMNIVLHGRDIKKVDAKPERHTPNMAQLLLFYYCEIKPFRQFW